MQLLLADIAQAKAQIADSILSKLGLKKGDRVFLLYPLNISMDSYKHPLSKLSLSIAKFWDLILHALFFGLVNKDQCVQVRLPLPIPRQ